MHTRADPPRCAKRLFRPHGQSRHAGAGQGFPRRILPRQPEHADLGAQPAPLRQHTIQNQPPRSSAHALQDALRQTRTRYDDERARIGRKQAAGTLRRENRRRHHHRAHDAVRLMRQLVRARRQQNPHADPRTGYPARPAVQAGRQVRSPAGRAQQAAAAFAPLHLRYRGDRRTRLARFDAREHGHPHARQLDDQRRRWHTRRGAHHGRAFGRQHFRHGQHPEIQDQFQPQGFLLRRQHRGIQNPQRAGDILHGRLLGRPRLLQLGTEPRAAQGVHPADGLRDRPHVQRHKIETLHGRPRHLAARESPQPRRMGRQVALHPLHQIERLPDGPLQLCPVQPPPARHGRLQPRAARPRRHALRRGALPGNSTRRTWSTDSVPASIWRRVTKPSW